MGISGFGIIYLIIGFIVAINRGYLVHITSIGAIISALLAILLWPLLLFGISLHLSISANHSGYALWSSYLLRLR
jgi:hypothetical protein